ncbi:hypothetical protein D3C76_1137740 [compost metagenome]
MQRLFRGADAALLHFLVGHYRHGGWRVEDAGRHLATHPQFLGNHRVGVIVGTGLDLGVDDDGRQAVVLGRAQFQRAGRLWLRYHQVSTRALLLSLKLGPLQQRRQCSRRAQRALHARRVAVGYALCVEGQADTGLARKVVKRRRQWATRNVPLLDLVVVLSGCCLRKRRQRSAADNQAQESSVHSTAQRMAL